MMKYIKLFEEFDFNDEDFDFEENDFSEHEKARTKYYSFWSLKGKMKKLSDFTYTELLKEIKRIKQVSKNYKKDDIWLKRFNKFLELIDTELEYRKSNPNR